MTTFRGVRFLDYYHQGFTFRYRLKPVKVEPLRITQRVADDLLEITCDVEVYYGRPVEIIEE